MKTKQIKLIVGCLALLFLGCSQDHELVQVQKADQNTALTPYTQELNNGATQISGLGVFAEECEYEDGEGSPDFALYLEGDLHGCLFVFVETYDCTPSGTYIETGREHFIGEYNGEMGSFWTNYRFEAKYEDCPALMGEIFGRCQHPIEAGSGEGVFEGVSGRIDFKDDIEAGNFPYRGHLRY